MKIESAWDFIANKYGIVVDYNQKVVPGISTSEPVQVVERSARRLALYIINTGQTTALISSESVPSPVAGFRLPPNGGTLVFDVHEDFMLPTFEWNAISLDQTTNLYVYEIYIVRGIEE